MKIQVRWKDTGHRHSKDKKDGSEYKAVIYRKMKIERYNGGWIIKGLQPENTNIHHCVVCAENAIDEQLPEKPRRDASARHAHGIKIIGEMVKAE